jgi:superfamily II DNA or RNA helicase
MQALCEATNLPCDTITGATPRSIRERILDDLREGRTQVLFATYRLAAEGLDIPRLDTLVLYGTTTNPTMLEQSIGRIARVFEDKADTGVVVDLVDNNEELLGDLVKAVERVAVALESTAPVKEAAPKEEEPEPKKEEPGTEKEEPKLSQRDAIKAELTELGVEFSSRARTDTLTNLLTAARQIHDKAAAPTPAPEAPVPAGGDLYDRACKAIVAFVKAKGHDEGVRVLLDAGANENSPQLKDLKENEAGLKKVLELTNG